MPDETKLRQTNLQEQQEMAAGGEGGVKLFPALISCATAE